MKKSILIVIIVMILAASTVALTACGTKMFPLNEERAGKQVTATVDYEGRVSIVSVDELYNQFYSYYNYLYTYYQYGYITADQFQSYMSNLDKTFENYNKSLAKSALYALKCIDFMSKYYQDANVIAQDDPRVVSMVATSTVGKTYNFGNIDDLNRFYADRIAEIQTILACHEDYSYVNSAIRSANSDLQSRFDSYVSTIEAEYAALEGSSKDTTPEGFVSISIKEKPYRLIYEVSDSATLDTRGLVVVANYAEATEEHGLTVEIPTKYLVTSGFSASSAAEKQEITVTYGAKTATFTVDIVAARPTREQSAAHNHDEEEVADINATMATKFALEVNKADYIHDGMTADELAEANQKYRIASKAMSRLNNYLETNYRDYNSYLYPYMVNQIRSLVEATKANAVTLSQADLDAEYARLIADRKAELAVTDFVKSDVESVESSLLQPAYEGTYGYYYVSQVLFKFTDEQSNAISTYKSAGNANATAIQRYTVNTAQEIDVWISNPDYVADATCELESCTCPHCKNYVLPEGAERPSYTTLDQWYTCADDCACAACPAKKYIKNPNSVDGSYNVMDVIADIEADIDAINAPAEAYTDANAYRDALLDGINEWIYKANEDSGAFSNITDKKYGYLMTPEGVSSGMVEAFELACDTLAEYDGRAFDATFAERRAELEAKGVFIESAQGGVGSYAWCVSEYGIHFVVLTAYAVDDDFGTVTDTAVGADAYKQLGLDYIYSTYEYDNSPAACLSVGGNNYAAGTIGNYLGSKLLEEKVSANYSKFQKDFISENEESHIKYNPKGYEYLLNKLQSND